MQYMGGKVRIAKYLVPVLQERLKDKETFVDLFCGSCNIISAIKAPNRIANDLHKELIALHKAVQQGWVPPIFVSEDDHRQARHSKVIPDYLKAFIGFGCSFAGGYFNGYARCKRGDNYALQSANSLIKKHQNMKDVHFFNLNYSEVNIPSNSLVYCDIPYKDTTKYSTDSFDHSSFYSWCKDMKNKGHDIVVSEYLCNVPEGWEVIWKHESKKDMRNKEGEQEGTAEVLMTPNN